jgi:hypothetical protein
MILLAAVAVALAALSYTLMVSEKDVPDPLPVSPVQHLEDRKRAIYDNLRDLQFEYRLGKLSDGDYTQTKQALQRELALVLSEIELLSRNFAAPPAQVAKTKNKRLNELPSGGMVCPHCQARFAQPLKFCGECGRAMA